jgi:hypothetical protein
MSFWLVGVKLFIKKGFLLEKKSWISKELSSTGLWISSRLESSRSYITTCILFMILVLFYVTLINKILVVIGLWSYGSESCLRVHLNFEQNLCWCVD